jgi:hypothetical protein
VNFIFSPQLDIREERTTDFDPEVDDLSPPPLPPRKINNQKLDLLSSPIPCSPPKTPTVYFHNFNLLFYLEYCFIK